MTRTIRIWALIAGLAWLAGLAGLSGAYEHTPRKKAEPPPGHEKAAEEHLKDVKQARKVVVAVVNSDEIVFIDLIDEMNKVAPRYMKPGQPADPAVDEQVGKEALDNLIFFELAVQEARRQGAKVKPEEAESALERIRADMGSASRYLDFLTMSGLTEETLKKKIERDLLYRMIFQKEIVAKVTINEEELRAAYETDKDKYLNPEQFFVADAIVLKGDNEDAMMNKAKEIRENLRKNNNDYTKIKRDGTFVARSGLITASEYPDLAKAAAKMKEGELSEVIRQSDGLHIIKVTKKEPARQLSFEEVRPMIENKAKAPLIEKRKQEWETGLKSSAKIELPRTVEWKDDAGKPVKD
jgi:parvulin-like peptidyl-prolyl isomerase